jgi:hypothetical protein
VKELDYSRRSGRMWLRVDHLPRRARPGEARRLERLFAEKRGRLDYDGRVNLH